MSLLDILAGQSIIALLDVASLSHLTCRQYISIFYSCNICELFFTFVGKIKVKGRKLQVLFCAFQLLLLEQFSIEKPQIIYCGNRFFILLSGKTFAKKKIGLTLLTRYQPFWLSLFLSN